MQDWALKCCKDEALNLPLREVMKKEQRLIMVLKFVKYVNELL